MSRHRSTGAVGAGLAGLALVLVPSASAVAASPQACEIVDADVESGTAMFVVGPDDCTGKVGPISFSTYDLPTGQIQPYEQQTLIAHASNNGASYGPGTYTLHASLGSALNWQADLYLGDSNSQAPHPHMIAVDAQTGMTAGTPTTVAQSPSVSPTGSAGGQQAVVGPAAQLPQTGATVLPRVLAIACGMTFAGAAIRLLTRRTTVFDTR